MARDQLELVPAEEVGLVLVPAASLTQEAEGQAEVRSLLLDLLPAKVTQLEPMAVVVVREVGPPRVQAPEVGEALGTLGYARVMTSYGF